MQLRIVHTTGYSYDAKVAASYNQARLTPQTSHDQIAVHARLEVVPAPWTQTYRDYFGALVTAFEVQDPHDAMTVTATSTVHTQPPHLPPSELTWEQVRDEGNRDRRIEYLALPPLVAPAPELAARVDALLAEGPAPADLAAAVGRLVHGEVAYRPGFTDVRTPADDSWTRRSGVCQDLAHVTIGALRHAGLPARYVSGYYHPSADPVVGETVAGESHAWVSWWDADAEVWRDLDPTTDRPVDERYVRLAAGRDYDDVAPLTGIYSGSAGSSMFVTVEVTRLG